MKIFALPDAAAVLAALLIGAGLWVAVHPVLHLHQVRGGGGEEEAEQQSDHLTQHDDAALFQHSTHTVPSNVCLTTHQLISE